MRSLSRLSTSARALRAPLIALGAIAIAASCNENLPSGPNAFSATLAITVPHDTIVIGDTSNAKATAMDGQGRQIQNLSFTWTSTDSTIVGFAASDTSKGRAHQLVAKKTGRASVSVALPDPRFAAVIAATRSEVGVVGGVKVLSTKDSTLTAVHDTALAIAAGLVKVNGALVPRASTGLRWTHVGQHVTVVGQGDTIRYISQANGNDMLIATNDFCLAGAKCADTVVARVAQVVSLTLSSRNFSAWSFGDSVGPTITLADRRGNGLPGASIRFVPATAADSALVKVSAAVGTTDPTTGAMATPKLITSGNGTAKAYVNAIDASGAAITSDSIFVVVRQVARRVAVEPLRALMTSNDSIPIRPVARDARGAPIADATITVTALNLAVNGIWASVPTPGAVTTTSFATIAPALTGVALPSQNPSAPQVDVVIDTAAFTLLKTDTLTASDTATRPTSVVILDSAAVPAVGKVVDFQATAGGIVGSTSADNNGTVSVVWVPPDTVGTITPNPLGFYKLIGVRSAGLQLNTLADSAGRVVVRRSVLVKGTDTASATTSTLAIDNMTIQGGATATITVTLKDRFGNIAKTGAPGDFSFTSALNATIDAPTCTNGVCTATYHAPATAVQTADTLRAKIVSSGNEMLNSPITLTITVGP
jgi:hypothetical protein